MIQIVQSLNKIGVKIFKTASADLSDYILHKTLSKFNKQVIISTGMSNIIDIKKCLNNYKSKKKYLSCIVFQTTRVLLKA